MNDPYRDAPRARLRTWLTICYTLFIVYGSLTPFTGWREQGLDFIDVLSAPLGLTYATYDVVINLLAYFPFGLLTGLMLRAYFGKWMSLLLGSVAGALMSMSMEYLQMFLPNRTSSNLDMLTNSLGTLLGVAVAIRLAAWPEAATRLTLWRNHLFRQGREADFGLALLALWVFVQINPTLPMLGNVFITELAHRPFEALPVAPFGWWQSLAVILNLLMLGTLMQTLLRSPHHIVTGLIGILGIVALAKFIAAAILLKSWALFLWINSEAMLGMVLGMLLMSAILRLPRPVILYSGMTAAVIYFAIINFELDSKPPSAMLSTYHWHYGHLLNYNGLAQTITMGFPLLLIFHLWRMRTV